MSTRGAILGYLLLTHGARNGDCVTQHPAARSQMRALQAVADRKGATLRVFAYDYARKVRCIDDLSGLFHAIAHLRSQKSADGRHAILIMDDYNRLFRAADPDFRLVLWQALEPNSPHLVSVRQGKSLHDLSPEMALLVKAGALPPLRLPKSRDKRSLSQRREQTEKARAVSRDARTGAAKRTAEELRSALEAYRAHNPDGSIKAFLASDAAQALRNAHGRRWTYRSALRVLRSTREDEGE